MITALGNKRMSELYKASTPLSRIKRGIVEPTVPAHYVQRRKKHKTKGREKERQICRYTPRPSRGIYYGSKNKKETFSVINRNRGRVGVKKL